MSMHALRLRDIYSKQDNNFPSNSTLWVMLKNFLSFPPPNKHKTLRKKKPVVGFLSQTDSTAACVGPITGPVCALPRWACFPGRPLLSLPGQSAAAAGRTVQDTHDQVCNGLVLGSSLRHRISPDFNELSIQGLVLMFLFLFLIVVVHVDRARNCCVCFLADGPAPFLLAWNCCKCVYSACGPTDIQSCIKKK